MVMYPIGPVEGSIPIPKNLCTQLSSVHRETIIKVSFRVNNARSRPLALSSDNP